jgi:hypothetical protein
VFQQNFEQCVHWVLLFHCSPPSIQVLIPLQLITLHANDGGHYCGTSIHKYNAKYDFQENINYSYYYAPSGF